MRLRGIIGDLVFAVGVVIIAGGIGVIFNLLYERGLNPIETYNGYGRAPAPSKEEPNPLPPVGIHSKISASKAISMVRHALFVDARSKEEFEKGHIPGAVSVPYSLKRLMPKEQGGGYSDDELAVLEGACVVIVYDSGDGSAESLHADLKSRLPVFRVLDGGVDAWRRLGGPWWGK